MSAPRCLALLAALAGGLLATVTLGAAPQSVRPIVLFDQGHGERFVIDTEGTLDLSGLAAVLAEDGLQVRATRTPLTDAQLAGVTALVISGAFSPLSPAEIETVRQFVARGGLLCVMLHVAPPLAPLLAPFGVVTSNGVIHERREVIGGQGLDFRVVTLAPHALTRDLSHFAVYGSWALLPEGPRMTALARTSDWAWVDLDADGRLGPRDARQPFGVLVAGRYGRGEVAVFGDDALFQNAFLHDNNLLLARNLARWLRTPAAVSPAR